MKIFFYILGFSIITLCITSCACDCVGPNDGNNNNKVCKPEYEAANGSGTWVDYESSNKNYGWICK